MTDKLKLSIENLYVTFSKYPGNPSLEGSPLYEHLDKWNTVLYSKPLQQLTGEELKLFSGKAITTSGDINDLKHFLPRLFELIALYNTPYDIWILYQKLEAAQWHEWRSIEQDAVKNFSLALWENILFDNSKKAEKEFTAYFNALAHFYPNFNELTEIWQVNNSFGSIKMLTNYIYEENYYLFSKGYIRGNEKSTRNIQLFRNWLLSERLIQKLINAYYQFEMTALAERILWILKILDDERFRTQQLNT